VSSGQYQVGIIGGGLAGLCSAIHLSKLGISCIVWEKGEFPRHKVCGEYVSTETLNYLSFLGFDPFAHGAIHINEFQVSHWNGDITHAQLDQGAFGLSRYVFDDALYQLALKNNATVNSLENVTEVEKIENGFEVKTNKGSYQVGILISAHGKKSNIDRLLDREFFHKDSDYIGIKYHYRFVIPPQQVSLHNFENGYCGVSMIEDEKINVCYLTTKSLLKECGSIPEMECQVLHKNPYLKDLFQNGENLFEEPKTISDFSFRSKTAVEDGILMIGDAAGLITPLCGNGMAMAIHAAYIVSTLLDEYFQKKITKAELESKYTDEWKEHFRSRIDFGYNVQKLFGKKTITSVALKSLQIAPFLLPAMIKRTHGKDFFINRLPGKDFFTHD
jgi:flavin-dependent dehydrogenase